jgi:molybdate transport system substrate-binding protein
MRRTTLHLIALALVLAASSPQGHAQTRDIVVFGATALRSALDEANALYLYENATQIAVTYGNDSALARQIEGKAPADVFIPGDPAAMDYVAERGLINPNTRTNFLGNKLVLVAGVDSKVELAIAPNFPLAQSLGNGRLAIADPAVAASGRSAKAALEALGVWTAVSSKVAPAQDERAALLMVARGEAPLGIVQQTDAMADKSVRIVATFPESTHSPIIYPIASLTGSTNVLAPIYLQYLLSPKGSPFFERRGFVAY